MDDEKIAYALKVMNENGIVNSGDALKLGIGAMTDERWKRFYETMAAAGVFPAGLDVQEGLQPRVRQQGRRAVAHFPSPATSGRGEADAGAAAEGDGRRLAQTPPTFRMIF